MKRSDHQLIQQVLDGAISLEAFDAFQERLRGEPELAKFYGEYALLHHSLCEEFEGHPVPSAVQPVAGRTISARIALVAIAALLLLAFILYRKFPSPARPAPVVAAVSFSADAVWQIDGAAQGRGAAVDLALGATLQLLHGQARVSPNPAATALIDGPCTLTFVSKDSLHLADGFGRFRLEKTGGRLEVTTPSISAVDLGTEFGIDTHQNRPDELHVFDGKVRMRLNGTNGGEILSAGEAGRVLGTDGIEHFTADANRFPKELGQFQAVVSGPFVKADWRLDYGNPSISGDRIDGVNYSVFRRLPEPEPAEDHPVMLVSLEVAQAPAGDFHTDGWAGMSFFSKGTELLFFGDSFGPERTWSLDVKQRIPIILPGNLVVGPRTVTLRYDRNSGDVSLHEGNLPLGPAFCTGKLPPGTRFDEIRLGASSSAALSVRSLTIRVGGERR